MNAATVDVHVSTCIPIFEADNMFRCNALCRYICVTQSTTVLTTAVKSNIVCYTSMDVGLCFAGARVVYTIVIAVGVLGLVLPCMPTLKTDK